MGSNFAFCPMHSTSFALYIDCLPARRICSNVIGQYYLNCRQTEMETDKTTKSMLSLVWCICRYQFKQIRFGKTGWVQMQQRFPAVKLGYKYVNIHICITFINIQRASKYWEKKMKKQSMVSGTDRAVKMSSNQFYQPINYVWTDYLSISLPLPDHPVLTLYTLIARDPDLFNTLLDIWWTVYDKNGGQNYSHTSPHQRCL